MLSFRKSLMAAVVATGAVVAFAQPVFAQGAPAPAGGVNQVDPDQAALSSLPAAVQATLNSFATSDDGAGINDANGGALATLMAQFPANATTIAYLAAKSKPQFAAQIAQVGSAAVAGAQDGGAGSAAIAVAVARAVPSQAAAAARGATLGNPDAAAVVTSAVISQKPDAAASVAANVVSVAKDEQTALVVIATASRVTQTKGGDVAAVATAVAQQGRVNTAKVVAAAAQGNARVQDLALSVSTAVGGDAATLIQSATAAQNTAEIGQASAASNDAAQVGDDISQNTNTGGSNTPPQQGTPGDGNQEGVFDDDNDQLPPVTSTQ